VEIIGLSGISFSPWPSGLLIEINPQHHVYFCGKSQSLIHTCAAEQSNYQTGKTYKVREHEADRRSV